jgi:predicted glycoside hydrolase/deacetylase ChbG (UPF0249 family)
MPPRVSRPRFTCIVNADDLGISAGVNDAIFELIAQGRITSASLLANGDAFEDAARRVKEFPQASFGVHLNATQFMPLSKNEGLRPLLTAGGEFAGQLRSSPLQAATVAALLDEFQLQLDRVRDWIGDISHVDSHHHVHTVPRLFSVLTRLIRRNGIRAARISRNIYKPGESPGVGLRIKKVLWNAALRSLPVHTADRFTDLPALLSSPPRRGCTVEIMTHPGHAKFAAESLLLNGDWERSLPGDVALINYSDLAAAQF